jgi:integrase
MPKLPYTFRRNGIYYMRERVPAELVDVIGKSEIRKSLNTSDPKLVPTKLAEARRNVRSMFTFEQKKLQNKKAIKHENQTEDLITLNELSSDEIAGLVFRWMDKQRQYGKENESIEIRSDEAIENLQDELSLIDLEIKEKNYQSAYASVKQILSEAGVFCDTKSQKYAELLKMFMRAEREYVVLSLQEERGDIVRGTGDNFFAPYFAGNYLEKNLNSKKITFKNLCARYLEARKSEVKASVFKGIEREIKVLRELIGVHFYLHQIDREKCREIFDLIKRLPINPKKKYPNVSCKRAIELSDKDGYRKIGVKRVNHYMIRLNAIMNFALVEGYISSNPASRLSQKDFRNKKDLRDPFNPEHLKKIFTAPLFTGCIDDEYSYKKVGSNRPRRARFWVPLISLWTGMRLEEICQLDIDDISQKESIDIIFLSAGNDKSLKTKNSQRVIPVHEELKRIGLLEYIKKIKKSGDRKLFPELSVSSTGNYSQPFSKWFGRFLDTLDISSPKLTFHSFRHNYRDALREVNAPQDVVNYLGGWAENGVSDQYGGAAKVVRLNSYHQQIKYPVDFSHLYDE